jgi:flavin reductase (DIM6/NTAB) family NADH-FMN oxidoreductase RutF
VADKFVSIVPDDLQQADAYRLMISVIVPRPIACVSTVSADGTPNLAPYSFFTGAGGTPPTVLFSVGPSRRESGPLKDTLRNAQETGEFVVNLVDEPLAEVMNLTSGDWPPGTDEFELAGLETVPSVDVKPLRVASAPIALEARVTQIVPVEDTGYTLVLGRVLRYHIREDLLRPNGLVDAALMRPIARLGGTEYATLGDVFSMTRPGPDEIKT